MCDKIIFQGCFSRSPSLISCLVIGADRGLWNVEHQRSPLLQGEADVDEPVRTSHGMQPIGGAEHNATTKNAHYLYWCCVHFDLTGRAMECMVLRGS